MLDCFFIEFGQPRACVALQVWQNDLFSLSRSLYPAHESIISDEIKKIKKAGGWCVWLYVLCDGMGHTMGLIIARALEIMDITATFAHSCLMMDWEYSKYCC